MNWYKWKIWRLAKGFNNSGRVCEGVDGEIVWIHLIGGLFWKTKKGDKYVN